MNFFANVCKGFNNLLPFGKFLVNWVLTMAIKYVHRNVNESFFRPREKPINGATINKRRELSTTNS